MNIVVCIKQVPDISDIKWTPENNLDRSQMLSKINLYDEWALDCAIKIKSLYKNVSLTVVSMGPNQASEILKYALAKGATRAILISDKAFSASDTIVTSKILAKTIRKYIPDFDLIITGQMAQDGDTAQVPVSLAQILDVPDVQNVVKIASADKNKACVYQKIDNITNLIEITTPCLLAIKEQLEESYIPKIEDYIRAQNIQIEIKNIVDLEFNKNEVGIMGSPTMVQKAQRPEIQRQAAEIKENVVSEILDLISKAKEV